MKTRRGVYYNPEETEFFFLTMGYKFYFSSLSTLQRFRKNLREFELQVEQRITKLTKTQFDYMDIAVTSALCLYVRIEKRFYYVELPNHAVLTEPPMFTITPIF